MILKADVYSVRFGAYVNIYQVIRRVNMPLLCLVTLIMSMNGLISYI